MGVFYDLLNEMLRYLAGKNKTTYITTYAIYVRCMKPFLSIYTVFHKIGTPLYFCNNILPCGPISIIDIPNCSAENWLKTCDTFTYLTFIHYLKIVRSHARNMYCRTLESRDARLHSTKLVPTQQLRSEPSRLKDLGHTARTGLQDKH